MCIQWRTKRLAADRLALGQLALVVGEDQVGAAPVEVDRLAEQVHRHGTALDVPARAPRTERRVPDRLVLQRWLPEHEVEGVALAGVLGMAAPFLGELDHRLGVVARE